MKKTIPLFGSAVLVVAAIIACRYSPSPTPTEAPTAMPTEAPTAMPTGTPTAAMPTEEPKPEGPSLEDTPERPAEGMVWQYCDRAQVRSLSLAGADAGWAMVNCYQDVGIRTISTEYLHHLLDGQWQRVDVPEEGIPGATSVYSCIRAISAVGPEEMWAVGMTHGVYGCQSGNWLVHYRNGDWEAVELEKIAELDETFYSEHFDGLLAIDMVDADNGWIAGYGLIFRYKHGQWSLDLDLPSENAGTYSFPSSDENAFRAISMANVNDGWAGGVGPLFRYQQGTWTRWEDPLFDSATVEDIDAIRADEAWAVGYRETEGANDALHSLPLMWHFVDDHWQEITLPIEEGSLSAVSMLNSDEGWAVGWADGSDLLLHYVNGQWQMVSPPSSRGLSCVASADPEHVWIGGAGGLYQYAPPDDWYHVDLGISIFSTGILEVDIVYTGNWYRDTFSYTRQAENIKHFVLVMPERLHSTYQVPAHSVFHSIRFQVNPDDPLVKESREEFAWAFDYLYEAPGGYFREEFVPGKYYLAVAFIAAPIGREEADRSDDGTPYPGVTGGGASTDYQEIVIEPEQTHSVTTYITDFMAAHRDRPFFVYYPMILVHSPFVPTPGSEKPGLRPNAARSR